MLRGRGFWTSFAHFSGVWGRCSLSVSCFYPFLQGETMPDFPARRFRDSFSISLGLLVSTAVCLIGLSGVDGLGVDATPATHFYPFLQGETMPDFPTRRFRDSFSISLGLLVSTAVCLIGLSGIDWGWVDLDWTSAARRQNVGRGGALSPSCSLVDVSSHSFGSSTRSRRRFRPRAHRVLAPPRTRPAAGQRLQEPRPPAPRVAASGHCARSRSRTPLHMLRVRVKSGGFRHPQRCIWWSCEGLVGCDRVCVVGGCADPFEPLNPWSPLCPWRPLSLCPWRPLSPFSP